MATCDKRRHATRAPLILLSLLGSKVAFAQASFDPPTSIKPPPNVMLLFDSTRTNQINASTCRGLCHAEGSCGGFAGEWNCELYRQGLTRIEIARRVLTGGYGWNTDVIGSDGGSADARVRTDGVMDAYKVRWGVAWYDGLGTRLAIDPTTDQHAAQKAVIDFGQTPNDAFGPAGDPNLNSFLLFPRTTRCCGNRNASGPYDPAEPERIPWWEATEKAGSRMARGLKWVRGYWKVGHDAKPFRPPPSTREYPMWFSPGPEPRDEAVIDGDPANVLTSPGDAGCRRNFTILLADGNGQDDYVDEDHDGNDRDGDDNEDDDGPGDEDEGDDDALGPGPSAARIYNLKGPSGPLPGSKKSLVFSIHFGVGAPPADSVADLGFDGAEAGGGLTVAFNAAPGGVLETAPMLGAFGAIFSLVLAGDYNGAAPTATRFGDHVVKTGFTIRNCAGATPTACNLGRPADLEWIRVNADGSLGATDWNAGDILRARSASDRSLFTGLYAGHASAPSETNCGAAATCNDRSARTTEIDPALLAPHIDPLDISFLRGEPTAPLANTMPRGDTNGDGLVDDPYKLADLVSSRPVVVGAPPGIGEDIARWIAFRERDLERSSASGGDGTTMKVKARDQIIYVGGNDGFLHAFLGGKAKGTPDRGSEATYEPFSSDCPSALPPTSQESPSPAACNGKELWGYSPRMLHASWPSLRSGHFYTVDGTPVVEDVLFTKGTSAPGTICGGSTHPTYPACGADNWEYRTVLIQCLSSGGPGCFAMDVTNPWSPELLWERQLTCPGPTCLAGKGTSTSQPSIASARRVVDGKSIPYYVALMGGGYNEAGPGGAKGTFIAIGLEDGSVHRTETNAEADFAGPPSCLDADSDGFVDTCYIATTWASVYKIRLTGGDPSSMSMVKFFDGRHATAADNPQIRAFTKIIVTPSADGTLNLFFATGNFDAASAPEETNFLFKIRDLDPPSMIPWDARTGGVLENSARQERSCSSSPPSMTEVHPGTFRLAVGEKVLFNPALVGGTVLFTSYKPDANPCVIGNGYLYGIRYNTCASGLDTNNDSAHTPDTDKAELGTGLPSEAAVSYNKGDVFIANSDTSIVTPPARPPPLTRNRFYKLRWREPI